MSRARSSHPAPDAKPSRAASAPLPARGQRARLRVALVLSVYLSVIAVGSLVWLGQRASAELNERGLLLGRELTQWEGLIGPSTMVRVNGQELGVSTLNSPLAVEQISARFAGLCRSEAAPVLADLLAAAKHRPALHRALEHDGLGTVKLVSADGSEAAVACIAGLGRGGLAGLSERLGTFAERGDLAAIGYVRYAFVQRTAAGSHVLAVWNERSLVPEQMFPAAGDAPGRDPEGVRPPDAVRVLAIEALGSPHLLALYETPRSPAEVLAHFARVLAPRGFSATPLAAAGDGRAPRAFVSDRGALVVSATAEAGSTFVSVVRLGSRGSVMAAVTP